MPESLTAASDERSSATPMVTSRSGRDPHKRTSPVRFVMSELCQTGSRHDFQFQIGRAGDLTCVMATPEIASSPPTINNFGVIRSPRNNTLEIKANIGSSRPNGATRPMKQRRSARTAPKISFTWTEVRNSLQLAIAPSACPLSRGQPTGAGALLPDRAGS